MGEGVRVYQGFMILLFLEFPFRNTFQNILMSGIFPLSLYKSQKTPHKKLEITFNFRISLSLFHAFFYRSLTS
jgi:hypothetical protein